MVVITVLSVGGSLINKENGIDDGFLKRISSILGDNGGKFGIVTGGVDRKAEGKCRTHSRRKRV